MNTRKYSIFVTIGIWLISANIAQAKPVDPKVIHVLNRLSYGIRAGDIDRVQSMGIDKYIREQLNPDSIAESPALTERLAKLDTIKLSPIELFQQYNPNRPTNGRNPEVERKIQQNQVRLAVNQAREAKLWRSIYSQRQLQEVMVDFWYNHFNVYVGKGLNTLLWVGAYEQEAIRPHTLGKFRDLVGATAKHPAMSPSKEKTTIVVMSEFGRTVKENGTGGTDHGHGNVMWLLGGGIRGGKVYGKWPGLEPEQRYQGRDLAVTNDFRDVLATVLTRNLALDDRKLQQILPKYTPQLLDFA